MQSRSPSIVHRYCFADVSIESPLPLPELAQVDATAPPSARQCTVRVDRNAVPDPFDIEALTAVRLLEHDDRGHVLGTADGTTFLLHDDLCHITVQPAVDTNDENLRRLLLDQILPRLLDLRGSLVLHASGVEVSQGGALFIGPSGSGKSTLAASFHRTGHRLVGDDCFVVDLASGSPIAHSTYRSLRLHPDSYGQIYRDAGPTDHSILANGKTQVAGRGLDHPEPLTLSTIIAIASDDGVRGPPQAERLSPRAATVELLKNSFRTDVRDRSALDQAFARAERIATLVPMFTLRYERAFSDFTAVHAEVARLIARYSEADPAPL